jgi:hypothetical protein
MPLALLPAPPPSPGFKKLSTPLYDVRYLLIQFRRNHLLTATLTLFQPGWQIMPPYRDLYF